MHQKAATLKQGPDSGSQAPPDDSQNPLAEWTEIQQRLAVDCGMSVLLVDGPQPPSLATTNNNSICQAIQSSPLHAPLCAPFCGDAHRLASEAKQEISYRCHAGLHCLAVPAEIGGRKDLAFIIGRAFLTIGDYREAVHRLVDGDLHDLIDEEPFQ